MTRHTVRRTLIAASLLAALGLVLTGCGEKIAIPEAEGLFGVRAYDIHLAFPDAGARQLTVANNSLFVVSDDQSLTKLSQTFLELERVDGLVEPTALCSDEEDDIIFVWESGTGVLSAWSSRDLEPLGAAELPEVRQATHLGASANGIDEVAVGATTFVYLADSDSLVVHRYAWYEGGVAQPMGILCRDDGQGTRFVHEPAGMVTGDDGSLYICDADTLRNWVISFDPTPDQTDVTPDPGDADPWRGIATVLSAASCNPPATADYVLGDAPTCGQTDWVGGPSDAEGFLNAPRAVALDSRGWFYVADTGNGRVQIFTEEGTFDQAFAGTQDEPIQPTSLGVVDKVATSVLTYYGALVYVVTGETGSIQSFISGEYEEFIDQPTDEQE